MSELKSLTINGETYDSFSSAPVAFFDLAATGLPALDSDGAVVSLAADTSGIVAALGKGLVKLRIQLLYNGMPVNVDFAETPMYTEVTGTYQLSRIITMGAVPMVGSITIADGGISAVANVLQASLPNAEGVSF